MSFTIGYADFVRLFRVEDPSDFYPGLELREDGVYVASPPDDVSLTPEERAVLTEHPTGDLSVPVLPFPFEIDQLESFVDRYGLTGYVDAFDLLKLTKRKAFEQASMDAKVEGEYHWPIVSGLYQVLDWVKGRIDHESAKHDRNYAELVVLREVQEKLDALLPSDRPRAPATAGRWPWGEHETELLRKLDSAAREWWGTYVPDQPGTAPKSKDVSAWLEGKNVGRRVAQIMAQILKADDVRPGPR